MDFIKPTFQRGLDDNLIVYLVSSSSSMEGAVEAVSLALASLSHESWYTRVYSEGLSNARNRTAYATIEGAADHYNAQASPSRDSGALWSQLLSVCAELNGTAGEIDLSSASAHLGELA